MSSALRKPRPAAPDPHVVQRTASNPESSVWVGASAGSGKTTVLVNRVLRLLLAGVKPQKILCITFTRAGAAEMSNRVTGALGRWAVCSDDELRASLDDLQGHAPKAEQLIEARRLFARTLACPGGMRIRTIHAFCQEILRRFPVEAGLPPHFAVIEEIEARALQEDVQTEVLRVASSDSESDLGRGLNLLVRMLGEYGFAEAMKDVLHDNARIAAALSAPGGIGKLVAGTRALFELADDDSEEKFRRDAVDNRNLPREDMLVAGRWLLEGGKNCAKRGQKMLDWLALPTEERILTFERYCSAFFYADGRDLDTYGDKKLVQKHPDLDPLMEREAVRLRIAKERIEAARTAAVTEAVITLGAELLQRYQIRKAAQALLDFDDLIIRTDALLRRPGIAPWVLFKLDGGLDHILVDEAQDTSRAQWDIVAALAEEFFSGFGARPQNRTLFVVGDEKQSIFSFQRADPEAFAGMRVFFAKRIDDAEKWREVPLHMSFRSAPAILKAVDAIFANESAREGVSNEPVEHFAQKEKYGRVEVWPLIPAPEKDKRDDEWTLPLGYEKERDPQAELAARIAGQIRKWLDKKEKLPGHARPIAPGDVMILLRRRGRFADLMVRALKEARVPVTGVDRMKLVKQIAVMDLLALMQFALLPEDDLNLACVLRGPLLGVSEDQLMELAIGRKGSLWNSLRDNESFAAARDYLEKWLKEADFAAPFAMLAHMLNAPCPGNAVSGRQALWARLGPDALDPIDELLNAAQDFGQRHAPSLQSFLHWLTATEAEIKRELNRSGGPNGGQVRIMTVHAAKGLEAPIVFLPGAADLAQTQDVAGLLWDKKTGVPLYVRSRPASGTAKRLWDEAQHKEMQEYRRLFYVALTRAEERLYIGGWEDPRNKKRSLEESWHALAKRGLQGLHEPAVLQADEPAEIAFADHILAKTVKEKPAKAAPAHKPVLPRWARKPAPVEPALIRPLAPSRLAAESEPPVASPDVLFARGRIIHRLLQSLPDVEDGKRNEAAARFLANPQHRLSQAARQEIAGEVLGLLRNPHYENLFGPGSRAEVTLTGRYNNQPVAGQIDRLCVSKDSVWIVDYKSNRPPPVQVEDVFLAYRQQLAAYRAVLADIYPGKTIRCFLLWTYGPRLMEIPEKMLAGA